VRTAPIHRFGRRSTVRGLPCGRDRRRYRELSMRCGRSTDCLGDSDLPQGTLPERAEPGRRHLDL